MQQSGAEISRTSYFLYFYYLLPISPSIHFLPITRGRLTVAAGLAGGSRPPSHQLLSAPPGGPRGTRAVRMRSSSSQCWASPGAFIQVDVARAPWGKAYRRDPDQMPEPPSARLRAPSGCLSYSPPSQMLNPSPLFGLLCLWPCPFGHSAEPDTCWENARLNTENVNTALTVWEGLNDP